MRLVPGRLEPSRRRRRATATADDDDGDGGDDDRDGDDDDGDGGDDDGGDGGDHGEDDVKTSATKPPPVLRQVSRVTAPDVWTLAALI